jgi:uncharacterized protein (DUF3820 family)
MTLFFFIKMNNEELIKILNYKMPYGKYKGTKLFYIPEHYLIWMKNNGQFKSTLGDYLSVILEIKVNGLEEIMNPLIKREF